MLPIHAIEAELIARMRAGNRLVLTAPAGSGKTTQAPRMLWEAGLAGEFGGRIVVTQPRRLAARMVAARVAHEMGVELGGLVGYETRHDRRVSAASRIVFMTEGLLLRQALARPGLEGVGVVVLDEFHERSMQADLLLGHVRRLQDGELFSGKPAASAAARREPRPPGGGGRDDLKLLVMSATLDAEAIAAQLRCPVLEAKARTYPIDVSYLTASQVAQPGGRAGEARPWDLAAGALRELLEAEPEGDVLIFMAGGYEIRRTIASCRGAVGDADIVFHTLHGSMPPREQDAAVEPDPHGRRKVIVATNVAQTSITIEGVRHVIDSGLAKVHRYDPRRGLNALLAEPISIAAADQRAGRAGRTAPGTCRRLWTVSQHKARAAHDTPEVHRVDLAEAVLTVLAMGVADPRAFAWVDPPGEERLRQAVELLGALGAVPGPGGSGLGVGGDGLGLTDVGRRMAELPLHPRLARMLIEAERRGCFERAALWAALVSERDVVVGEVKADVAAEAAEAGVQSDLAVMERLFLRAREARFDVGRCRGLGVSAVGCREVDRVWGQLVRMGGERSRERGARSGGAQGREALGLGEEVIKCLLVGFPDHVAVRWDETRPNCAMPGRKRVVLDRRSVVKRAGLLLALDVREIAGAAAGAPASGAGGGAVKTVLSNVSAVEPDWLAELFPGRMTIDVVTRWNESLQAAEDVEQHAFDGLVFEETVRPGSDADAAAEMMVPRIVAGELKLEHWNDKVEQWLTRARCVAAWFPDRGMIKFDDEDVRVILHELVAGATRFAQVRDRGVLPALQNALSWDDQRFIEQMAPTELPLPGGGGRGGRKLKIEYREGAPPVGRAKIQELYGLDATPAVAGGRVKLLLEILGPNYRPVQVTDDLPGFWERTYPQVKKDLARRYPKHKWR